MRLGSGIAPIAEMRAAGVKVGLAVDGSASNDSSNLIAEARQALLLQRASKGASAFKVMEALELATLGGAGVLNRDDIGYLAPGMAADFVGFDLGGLDYSAAAAHDPVGALILCTPPKAALSVVNGRVVVDKGEIPGLDVQRLAARQNEIARVMIREAS
jgi:cytosine/adenosine deaminase-related metal-dependent hydrolase